MWYTFTTHYNRGLQVTQDFAKLLVLNGVICGGMAMWQGVQQGDEVIHYVHFPEHLEALRQIFSRSYPLTRCEKPAKAGLISLVANSGDDALLD